ncbi:hypothetical protein GSY74_00670 [Sulfurovum sp. bin170]|uniref:hypothetical protein n=1 Tax=Sulfurovum sp. bin170 TaxID=2695268 RepID=UPI0013DED047|nr:hypothetical protein [Sulfurovum sp. bin170]NEW59783.1 hypothetical protein [Sulfurovum sp. bin170]
MKRYISICLFLILFPLTLFGEVLTEESQPTTETIAESVEREEEVVNPTEPIVEITQKSTTTEDREESSNTVEKNTEDKTTPSISTLIEQLKTAKAEDRRELMNQLKVELRAMNKEKRQETMRELKQSFANNGQGEQRQQNMQQRQFIKQPQYRQLHNGHGQGGGRK